MSHVCEEWVFGLSCGAHMPQRLGLSLGRSLAPNAVWQVQGW